LFARYPAWWSDSDICIPVGKVVRKCQNQSTSPPMASWPRA
jgi:hypothetical protein